MAEDYFADIRVNPAQSAKPAEPDYFADIRIKPEEPSLLQQAKTFVKPVTDWLPGPKWLNPIMRGFNEAQAANSFNLGETGLLTNETIGGMIAKNKREAAAYPMSQAAKEGMLEIQAAGKEGWGSLALAMLTNPSAMGNVIGESIPMMAEVMVGAAPGTLAKSPMLASAGAGAVSFAAEYASTVLDTLADAKVDLTDAKAVEKALDNPELMAKARKRGVERGVPIGIFDALSVGLAGTVTRIVNHGAKGVSKARKIIAEGGEIGLQGGLGGGGEATAQLAEKGEIYDRSAIGLEAGAEGVTGVGEQALAMVRNRGGEAPPPPPVPGAPPGAAPASDVIGDVEPEIAPPAGVGAPPAGGVPPGGPPAPPGAAPTVAPPAPMSDQLRTEWEKMAGRDVEAITSPEPGAPTARMKIARDQSGVNTGQLRVFDPSTGDVTVLPTTLLRPTGKAKPVAPEVADVVARPDSPRITPADRKSPIPTDIIDDGKALVESATGRESTYTTTQEINGKRTVVTGKVSDLVAENRAETNALIAQITAGVSQPFAGQTAPVGAPLAGAAAPAATVAPTAPAAPVRAPVADSSGFKPGPDGYRYRVSRGGAAGGIALEKRSEGGSASTFYIGKDGNLIDADYVAFNDPESVARVWKPPSPEAAAAALEIMDEMGAMPLNSPERASLKQRLKDVVLGTGKAASPAPISDDAPAFALQGAREGETDADTLTRRFGPEGSQARTLEEARLAKGDKPIVTQTPTGGTIEVRHPYYESFEAWVDGKKVGTLNVSPQGPHTSSVIVDPSAQRKGVATALYNAAEAALGRKMTPSPMGMSGDAVAFWNKRLSEMEPEEKQAILQEALDKGEEQKIGKSARARMDALGYEEPPQRNAGETDKEFAKRVVDKRPEPKKLPENYSDYFLMDKATIVPIGDLVSSKSDEENKKGGGNAAKRMEAAAKGELSRRDPITVQRQADGKYLILDGNGTYTSVKGYGWKSMPVVVEKAEAAAKAAPAAKPEPAAQTALKEKIAAKREEKEEAPAFSVSGRAPAATPVADHPRETNQVVGAGQLTSFTGRTATPIERAVFRRHRFATIDALYEHAQERQDELAAAGEEIAANIQGITFKNPPDGGLKAKEKAAGKIKIKGYNDARQITDVIRIGFTVTHPGQANEIIRSLARRFEVLDEGWFTTPFGYFDRKALVRFDDGRLGEVQFWEPNVLRAKEDPKFRPDITGGVKDGHDIYDEANAIKDKTSPRRIELIRQMNELYGHALSLADSAWAKVISDGKLSKPDPKYLNLRRQSTSGMTPQVIPTSMKSASTQSVSPGLSSALASKSVNTTGRSSQLQNFTGTPPFDNNVVRSEGTGKPEPEAQRALKEKIEAKRKAAEEEEPPAFQARSIREGTESPETFGLPSHKPAEGKKKPKKITYTTRQIAAALEARQRERYGTIGRDDRSPEAVDKISDWIVDEVDFEMQPGREERSGRGWYSEKFQNALNHLGNALFPELVGKKGSADLPGVQRLGNQKNARNFLTALIAITSDGALAELNWINAGELYGEFRQTGTIDIDKVTFGGDRNASVKENLANALHLLSTHGPEKMHTLLMDEKPVSDLKKTAEGLGTTFSTKYQAHIRMPLAAVIFGPKLGAFYANLMGAHGYLTMDRWWSRTFNRYRGQLLTRISGLMNRPTDRQGNKIGLAKFKESIGQPNLSDEEALVEAARHTAIYGKEKKFKNGTDIEKAANTITKAAFGTEDTPFGSVDRTFMIDTVEAARSKLAARGINISLADIQAILWYFEKRLYSELGARATADVSYEEIARRIAEGTVAGNRSARPDASDAIEGPDGASFSLREGERDQTAGGRGGADRQRTDVRKADAVQGATEALPNLYEIYPSSVGPNERVVAAKQAYMESIGLPFRRQAEYVKADPKRGKRIADAFDAMLHDPTDPDVLAAYRAMIDETVAQFRVLQKHLKLKIEFIKSDQENPYQDSPRLALEDVLNNGHLWVFPTLSGFGSVNDIRDNPLLEPTGIKIDGHDLVANDIFRIVHDIFGHATEGAGFGPTGEENAWQSHVRMYSPLAAKAMSSETRGQNSWVNFGPFGEKNRADPKNTTFADQKVGILPDWAMTEGMAEDQQPDGSFKVKDEVGGVETTFELTPAFVKKAKALEKGLRAELDRLGLKDIALRVSQTITAMVNGELIDADGRFLRGAIDIALTSVSPLITLHHEVVHGLRKLGLFGKTEWSILERMSRDKWMAKHRIGELYKGFSESRQIEEGIAFAYQAWKNGQKFDPFVTKAFKKIESFIEALGNALRGQGFRSADSIFRAIDAGQIGNRQRGQEVVAETESLFQLAWHGSKSRFTKFSNEFYGKGQGEARYGSGFYFARGGDRQYAASYGNGVVYKVDIPETEDMLEWDEKLTNQPKGVQEKLEKVWEQLGDKVPNNYDQNIYYWISGKLNKGVEPTAENYIAQNKLASDMLDAAGIPGIAFERRGQKGAVVFNADNVEILSVDGPAFALTAPPATSQQAQQTMQGFLNRGQPVDRAIRFTFDLIGGLDSRNRWRPSHRLNDKLGEGGRLGLGFGSIIGAAVGSFAAGPIGAVAGGFAAGTVGAYILGSKANPTRFAAFNAFAENAKAGLVANYGLDPEYVEAYRQSDLGKAGILRQAQGIMKVLSNAHVTSHEATVLQKILSGKPVQDADMTRLAGPIRKAIDDLGAEAVSLGLISAESFERNRGAYLHRVYLKHEVDAGTMASWVSSKMASRRKRIIGDSLKGRGIFLDMTVDRLMKDAPNRAVPAKGDMWRVLDRTSADGKVTRRVYVPTNKPIPTEFTFPGWVDKGEWEVRHVEKGQATLWRDYTEVERGKMGELLDARYTIAKTFMLLANDISTGRFYKTVAENPLWTSEKTPAGKSVNAEQFRRTVNDPDIQWVKVPDTAIDKTGGKKRWGALAGKYVRAEIWRDLNEINIAQSPAVWKKLYRQWKRNKTARNPVVHMNNIMSNVMFMDLADIRGQDLVAGMNAYFRNTKDYKEALDNGAFGADLLSQEIRDEVLKPILNEINKQNLGATTQALVPSGFLSNAKMLGVFADKLWGWAKTADNGMLRAYQAEDEVFRMALYMRRRAQGQSPKMAAMEARDQFLNYDIRAPWIVALKNTVLPFISYSYRAVPKLAENIIDRPWKIAKYMAIIYAVNALAYMGDDDDDEEQERAALRDEEQGITWLGIPRMVRMPWRDQHGLPVFLDIRRWIPAGDIYDSTQGNSALPVPAPLQFGGPLMLAYEFYLNKQAFSGKDITNELTQDSGDKLVSVGDWAWKAWAPSSAWTPRSWYWTRLSNAYYGAKDITGRPYSLPQAALSSVGIKVKSLDVEDGIKWHFVDFKRAHDALTDEQRSAARQLGRGLISQDAYNDIAADIYEKRIKINEKREALGELARPKDKRKVPAQ